MVRRVALSLIDSPRLILSTDNINTAYTTLVFPNSLSQTGFRVLQSIPNRLGKKDSIGSHLLAVGVKY